MLAYQIKRPLIIETNTAAERIRCPVAFVQQDDDELHPLASSQALFERIGAPEKQLLRSPGGHSAVPAETYEAAVDFMARHLLPS